MKPIVLIGIFGVIFSGCHNASNRADSTSNGNAVGCCMPWEKRTANPQPVFNSQPVTVVMTSPDGSESSPKALAHLTLPPKIECCMPWEERTANPQPVFNSQPVTVVMTSPDGSESSPKALAHLTLPPKIEPAMPKPFADQPAMWQGAPVAALASGLPHPSPPNQPSISRQTSAKTIIPGTSSSFRESSSVQNGDWASLTLTTPKVTSVSKAEAPAPSHPEIPLAPEKPALPSSVSSTSADVDKLPDFLLNSKRQISLADPVTTAPAGQTLPAPHWPDDVSQAPLSVPSAPKEPIPPSNIRLVNSKRIDLNYEIKNADPSAEVELWCTRDGRTWSKWQTLDQDKSPGVTEVDDEDLYGFTLLVRSASSPVKQPKEGDRPQVWVEVDITKPIVRLMGIEPHKGSSGRSLTILWKAFDKNLLPNPITLAYATEPHGPWMPIAGHLENTGRFVWKMPADAPDQFFIRVEATDQAGNVGAAQTPRAIVHDQSEPSAAILAVEPTKDQQTMVPISGSNSQAKMADEPKAEIIVAVHSTGTAKASDLPQTAAAKEPSLQQLQAILRDSLYASQREIVVEILAAMDWHADPNIIPILIQTAQEDCAATVRAACVRWLAQMHANTGPVMQALQKLQFDPESCVRAEVKEALQILRGN